MSKKIEKESVVADIEYHETTGEVLTVWLRKPDKTLISLIPVGYKIETVECPWSERFHGGIKPVKKVTPIVPEGYADHLSGNWDDVPDWAISRINFLEEQLKRNDEMRCPLMGKTCPKDGEHSCHTIKHCYPYICDGSCGHNEVWISDNQKGLLTLYPEVY
jgi:hypothetical protein